MLALLLRLGDGRFALPSTGVLEVLPQVTLQPAPDEAAHVAGLFCYRGGVAPVIDLGLRLRGSPCSRRLGSRIVVVQPPARSHCLGLLVDAVLETRRLRPGDLVDAPVADGTGSRQVLVDAQGVIPVLRLEALLNDGARHRNGVNLEHVR